MTDRSEGDPLANSHNESNVRVAPASAASTESTATASPVPPPASPDLVAAPAPSGLLFGDAPKMYPKRPVIVAPEPEPELIVELPEEPPPPLRFLPHIVLDPPIPRRDRLTVPPSPLAPPRRPSQAPPAPPSGRSTGRVALVGAGSIVLLGIIGFTVVIANHPAEVREGTPDPAAELPLPTAEPPIVIVESTLGAEDSPEDRRDPRAVARRAGHSRRDEHAAATPSHDPSLSASPSSEQIAMAARAVRGPVLMCGMSLPVTETHSCDIAISFDSSGHVANASVGAPYAGTPYAACMARAARRMTVPPFNAPTYRVTQSFQVR